MIDKKGIAQQAEFARGLPSFIRNEFIRRFGGSWEAAQYFAIYYGDKTVEAQNSYNPDLELSQDQFLEIFKELAIAGICMDGAAMSAFQADGKPKLSEIHLRNREANQRTEEYILSTLRKFLQMKPKEALVDTMTRKGNEAKQFFAEMGEEEWQDERSVDRWFMLAAVAIGVKNIIEWIEDDETLE